MLDGNAEPVGAFTCPRCKVPTVDDFYGPCADCRGALRAAAAPAPPPRLDTGDRASRRIWRTIHPRPTAWVDVAGDRAASGSTAWTTSTRSLRALLDSCPDSVERFYLSGRPGDGSWEGFLAWCDELPAGWSHREHFQDYDAPVMRFAGPGGRNVEVRMGSGWWGDGAWTPAQAAQAWDLLRSVIGRRFDGAELLASPAASGLELWTRSIGEGVEWQTVAGDVAELIRANSTQARLELVAHDELPALVEYDGRWMYSALCTGLPSGPTTWASGDPGDAYDPYAGGWYEVRAIVPDDWTGLGILPHLSRSDGWSWPATPGLVFDGWVSAVELAQARAWGWECQIRQSVTFAKSSGPGPLDKWVRRLQAARAELEQDQAHDDPTVRQLAAGAVRAIHIQAIGSMLGKARLVTCSASIDDPVPANALRPHYDGDRLVWEEERPPAQPDLVHPEWTSTIWARCRARMLDGPGAGRTRTGALHVPAGDVVAIRTDALYLTADPRWADDGANGRLRLKASYAGPFPGPTDHGALLRLKREAASS